MKLLFRVLKYLKNYPAQLAGLILCMIIVSFSNVGIIPLVGKISEAIGAKNLHLINIISLAILSLYFIKGVFMYGQVYLSAFVGQGVVRDLRLALYSKMNDFSLDFFAKWRIGDLISRTLGDIRVVQRATVSSATEIIPNILTLISILGYLFYLNWKLALMSVITIPLLAFTMNKFGREMRSISRLGQRKAADLASLLQETISGIRIVKSFAMETHEVNRFSKENERSFWISLRTAAIHATQTPLLSFIQAVAIVSIVWYGSFQVVSGSLSASNLIAFFTGIALLADPISKLSKLNMTIQTALAAAERVYEILDLHPTVKEDPNPINLENLKGSVEFKDVTFQYENSDENALKNINVKVKPGEIIALVGSSGSGKTTFVNLLPRFYDPAYGSILVDNVELKKCGLYSLRKQMGIVPQETFLFSGTIKDNILYGKVDASDEEVINAAKQANAHDFIMDIKDNYNTIVGEKGVRLSGGQRQRVAIARALLRNPKILILDEATSSLDSESERLVQDALEKLMNGRTTFVIAHRLSTIQIADRILVLDNGKISEEGTHSSLIDKNGIYKKLYNLQFRDEKTSE